MKSDSKTIAWNDSQRYLKLTPYEEILSKIKSHFGSHAPKTEPIQINLALGRISAGDVISDLEIPPRTTAAMDGYALRWADVKSATTTHPKSFNVRGSIYPNHFSKMPILHTGDTYYVATGAPLPVGTDAVARVEETRPYGDNKIVEVRHAVQKGKNIAKRAEDIRKGQVVVRKGQILSPIDVALLMGVGRTHIDVYKIATVGLLSIGDELREFSPNYEKRHNDGYVTNNYLNLLSGYLEQFGSKSVSLGICGDETREISQSILQGVKKCDMVLTISGSSVGRHDNVLDALESIKGSITLFHGTRVVPIRPSGVVIVHGKPVVMIPGHAVSALLTFFTVALPILNMISGLTPHSRKAIMNAETANEVTNDRAIEALSLMKLKPDGDAGNYKAFFLDWGSNLLSNLSKADGFVWLSPHQTISKNQIVTIELFSASPVTKSSWSSPLY